MVKRKNTVQKAASAQPNGDDERQPSTSFASTQAEEVASSSAYALNSLTAVQSAEQDAQAPANAKLKGRVDILAASAAMAARDTIKVNNMNVTELKNACDDVMKKLLSQPGLFQENHMHTDVKLLLGWASVIVAGATALYGWKADFEQSKPFTWAGVILYVLLTTTSTLYSFFIEKDAVFVGRRKTLAKRIETENITVSTHSIPAKGASTQNVASVENCPRYRATVTYVRSSNGGKSLLGKGKLEQEKPFNAFFNEDGTMDQGAFERWVGILAENVIDGR